ncbi:hypothetical protein [Maribacter hydrothermalis]|nr:hypothetical protein [Maribacter hydrothermalis]
MIALRNTKRSLGYFETASHDEMFEISNFTITNSELILEAMAF